MGIGMKSDAVGHMYQKGAARLDTFYNGKGLVKTHVRNVRLDAQGIDDQQGHPTEGIHHLVWATPG